MASTKAIFQTISNANAFGSESFNRYVSSNLDLLTITCTQITHPEVRKIISNILRVLELRKECNRLLIEQGFTLINQIEPSPARADLTVAHCILNNIKNAIPDEKINPTLSEHALRLGQEILLKEDINSEFKKALNKFSDGDTFDLTPPGGIFICHEKSNKPYLKWVDRFVENLQNHIEQSGIWLCNSTYNYKDNTPETHLERIINHQIVIVIGTETFFENSTSYLIQTQRFMLQARLLNRKLKTIPILISGDALPDSFGMVQEWQKNTYFQNLCQLIPVLYNARMSMFVDIWDKFLNNFPTKRLVLETGLSETSIASWLAEEKHQEKQKEVERKLITDELLASIHIKKDLQPLAGGDKDSESKTEKRFFATATVASENVTHTLGNSQTSRTTHDLLRP